jgi:hypothetical protein
MFVYDSDHHAIILTVEIIVQEYFNQIVVFRFLALNDIRA